MRFSATIFLIAAVLCACVSPRSSALHAEWSATVSMLADQQRALHQKDPRYDLPGAPKPTTHEAIRTKERTWGQYLDADHRALLLVSDGLHAFCGVDDLFSLADSAPGSQNWERMKAFIEGASLTPASFGAHSFDQLIPVIGSGNDNVMTITVSHPYFTDEPGIVFQLGDDGPNGIGQYPTLMDAVKSLAERYRKELQNVSG